MEDFKEKESTSTNKRRESLIENKDRRQKLGNSHDFLLDELSSNPRITSQSEANGSDAMGVSHENAGVVASNVRDVSRCDDDDSNMRVEQDIVQFFTGSCVLQDDLGQHGPAVLSALEAIVDQMEARGEEMYLEHKTKKKVESLSNSNPTFPADKKASGLHANQIDPSIMDRIDPRSYQTALLNIAVKQNTIVHLGTGTG